MKPEENERTSEPEQPRAQEYIGVNELHGLDVSRETHMMEALARLCKNLTEEYQEDVSISVLHMETVLTQEEMASMEALNPMERIFLLLEVLGYQAEEDHILEEQEYQLSEEYLALREAVMTRLSQMNDDDQAEIEEAIQKFFVEDQNGEEGPVLRLEVQIESSDAVQHECYEFVQQEGQWFLNALYVKE